MSVCRLCASLMIALGAIGPAAVWSAPDAPAPTATVPAMQTGAVTTASGAELLARLSELRGRQQADPGNADLSYQLGVLYLDLGQAAAAQVQLRRALDLGGKQPDLWPLIGQTWLLQQAYGDVQDRIPFDTLPGLQERAAVRVLQGLAYLAQERPREARGRFREALALIPDYSPAYVGRARTSLAEGNQAEAKDALEAAANGLDRDPAEVATLRGNLAAADGDFATAQAAYREAAQARPGQLWRLRPLAQVQIARHELDEADANLERIAGFVQGDQVTLWLMGLSALRRGDYQRAADTVAPVIGGQVQVPGLLLVAGTAAYHLGQDQQARKLLELYLKGAPGDPDGLRTLGATLIRLGEPREALALVEPLVQGGTPADGDLLIAGLAAALTGDTGAGLGYLRRAGEQRPNDATLRRLMAAVQADTGDLRSLERLADEGADGLADLELGLLQRYLLAGDYSQVLTAAERFQRRYPNRAAGYLYQGIALVRSGKPTEARPAFDRALSLSPRDLDILLGSVDAQLAGGDPQGALAAIIAVLKDHPRNPLVAANLITVALAAGHPERAIQELERLSVADPRDQALAVQLARAYRVAGRPMDALKFLDRRGATLEPSLQRERGLAQQRAGQLAAAVTTFRGLADANPESVAARIDLARALQEAGDLVAAGRLWEEVLAKDPDNGAARIGKAWAVVARLAVPPEPAALEAAIGQAATALKEHPDAAGAVELRTLALILARQAQQAVAGLTPIVARDHEPRQVMLLSRARFYAGDQVGSLGVLRDHVARFPGDPQVRWELAQHHRAGRQLGAAMEQWAAILALDCGRTDADRELNEALIEAADKDQAVPQFKCRGAGAAGR